MVIQSGDLNYGEQLPIPEGYTEDECIWLISPYDTIRVWHGSAQNFSYQGVCYLDNNRINKSYSVGDGPGTLRIHFLVIAVHGATLKDISPRTLEF